MKIIELKNKLGEMIIPKKWEPIGTIKMFSCEMDMNKYYYGTWELTLKERSPIGVNISSTEDRFKTAGQQFGEKTHKLTIEEMPRHNHTSSIINGNEIRWGGTGNMLNLEPSNLQWTAGPNGSSIITGTSGAGQAHNNIHPVETVYFYKRVA